MTRFAAIAALAAFATVAFAAEKAASADGDVVVITKSNVDDVLKKDAKDKLVFVKFFAPWCGHCQAMAEDFKSAATALKGKAVLAEVDATKEEKIVQNFKVEGFPTLKLFSNGEEVADYQGNRDKESMIKFVERAMLPAYVPYDTKKEYDAFVAENKANRIVVAVIGDAKEAVPAFKKAAYSIRDVMENIAFVAVKDVKAVKGASKGDIYYSDIPEGKAARTYTKYDDKAYATIDKFVKTVGLPVFQEFTQENADMYVELGVPVIVGFFKEKTDAGIELMKKVALKKANNGKVAFAWVDAVKLSSFVEYVGLKDKDPAICAYSFESDQRFLLPADFKLSEKSLEKWVDAMIAGTVEPTRKSEPVPEKNDGPVYTVVGDSWEKFVEDPKTDVMVAQVASWCGHCKALKPIYAKVAKALADAKITTVKLALMDATENDAPGAYKAKGFPTIHFFPAGKTQKGMDFEGDRSSKAIVEFLLKNAGNKFKFDVKTLGEDPAPAEEEEEEPLPEDGEEGAQEGEGAEGEEGFEGEEEGVHDDEAAPAEDEEKQEL